MNASYSSDWQAGRPIKSGKSSSVLFKYIRLESYEDTLNNLVEQYLIFAQGQAMRRVPMYMKDWINKLDGFLTINDREILKHTGKISHEMATLLAENKYEKYHTTRIADNKNRLSDFDRAVKQIDVSKKKGGK